MLDRPKLHQELVKAGLAQWTLAQLCGYLYDDEAVDQQLLGRTQILTPVTLRAEAWVSAILLKPKWGGARTPSEAMPAGRPEPGGSEFPAA